MVAVTELNESMEHKDKPTFVRRYMVYAVFFCKTDPHLCTWSSLQFLSTENEQHTSLHLYEHIWPTFADFTFELPAAGWDYLPYTEQSQFDYTMDGQKQMALIW